MGFKLFADNNIDEPSEVIEDTNSDFANMELNLEINSAKANLNIFKMNRDFVGDNREEINNELPGYHNGNEFIGEELN